MYILLSISLPQSEGLLKKITLKVYIMFLKLRDNDTTPKQHSKQKKRPKNLSAGINVTHSVLPPERKNCLQDMICSICKFPLSKYSYHDGFQVATIKFLNTELGIYAISFYEPQEQAAFLKQAFPFTPKVLSWRLQRRPQKHPQQRKASIQHKDATLT